MEQYLILSNNNNYQQQQAYNNSNNSMRQLNVNSSSSQLSYVNNNSNSKYRSRSKINYINNANQQLQDLLQSSDTINQNYMQTEKKRLLFNDMSFFSKDNTQDFTNQQGYNQLVSKIHFERSRNRQLINQLTREKEKMIQKYLQQIMDQFKQLSDDNKRLRQVYKKQAGGGYKIQKTMVRNNSAKNQQIRKTNQSSHQNAPNSTNMTPRNSTTQFISHYHSRIGSRKSITTLSVAVTQQPMGYNSINNQKMVNGNKSNRVFFGVGGGNFYQTQKLDTLRPMVDRVGTGGKMYNCESSINMHTGNNVMSSNNNVNGLQIDNAIIQPSPRVHKRRQSQLTQRKDYPLQNTNKNYNDEFLMMCDQGEMSFYGNQDNGRMSLQQQKGKMMMMKNKQKVKEMVLQVGNNNGGGQLDQKTDKGNNNNYNNNTSTRRLLNESIQRASFKLSLLNQQQQSSLSSHLPIATNKKNIFIQFLQTLLIQQHLSSQQLTQDIQQTTCSQQRDMLIPSYHNIRYIQQLQKEIMTKNIKLRQLQQVINVFKQEIQQIVGTDVKMVNQLMVQLLQVKGKYMEMQEKVDKIAGLRGEVQQKEKVKENILMKMKKQQEKQNKQSTSTYHNDIKTNKIQEPSFPIPQSIQTLFQLLNINIPKNSKPIQYLNQIKKLPKNQDLFQAFDSKKRTQCNIKIKQVIDQIKQGRKKFNQVIKIYQGRIVKLQQKIHKYKVENNVGQGRQYEDKQNRRLEK